jgi:hypothetical protein
MHLPLHFPIMNLTCRLESQRQIKPPVLEEIRHQLRHPDLRVFALVPATAHDANGQLDSARE